MSTAAELAQTHPRLYRLLELMALDNDLSLKEYGLPWISPALEAQASSLDDEGLELMAAGEQSERDELVEEYGLQMLDQFLASAFDGDLHKELWREA